LQHFVGGVSTSAPHQLVPPEAFLANVGVIASGNAQTFVLLPQSVASLDNWETLVTTLCLKTGPADDSHPTTPKVPHVTLKTASFSVVSCWFGEPLAHRIKRPAAAEPELNGSACRALVSCRSGLWERCRQRSVPTAAPSGLGKPLVLLAF